MPELPTIAVIGGTGALGSGLAKRLAGAGYPVVIGSRDPAKAAAAAARLGSVHARGAGQAEAARAASVVILAVPFASQAETLATIAPACAGKLVIDTTVPLVPPKVGTVQLPEGGGAAANARRALDPSVRVVSAFHNVSAAKLQGEGEIECDVLVFGDAAEDREATIRLVEAAGLRGFHGGPLANS
ncbi:MAG: NAD(P)-binding domain-containing protein, partial [Pseudomonadota bacterium]